MVRNALRTGTSDDFRICNLHEQTCKLKSVAAKRTRISKRFRKYKIRELWNVTKECSYILVEFWKLTLIGVLFTTRISRQVKRIARNTCPRVRSVRQWIAGSSNESTSKREVPKNKRKRWETQKTQTIRRLMVDWWTERRARWLAEWNRTKSSRQAWKQRVLSEGTEH